MKEPYPPVNSILSLKKLAYKELGKTLGRQFYVRMLQLTLPLLGSYRHEVALDLRAYILWGDEPTFSNHLIAVAFDDLSQYFDALTLQSMHESRSIFNTNPSSL